jgi:nitric oxide reductase subunit C
VQRLTVFIFLFLIYAFYTCLVYSTGTKTDSLVMSDKARSGKLLFQKYNCTACHQLYGLGGYLGPDLTNVISQPGKGELYSKLILQKGYKLMPSFHLEENEVTDLIEFLRYVDATEMTNKNKL